MTKEGLPLKDISTYDKEEREFTTDIEKNAHDKANAAAPQPGDFPEHDWASDYIKYSDKDPNNY